MEKSALISVNGNEISMAEAVRRDIMHDNEFLKGAIQELLIREYAENNDIHNTDEELQVAADEMRYMRGLESREETLQWLDNTNQTIASVQNGLDYQILRNKVRNSIPEDEMRAYFADHKVDFQSVDLYSIRVDSREVAEELYAQIAEDGVSFHDLAIEYSTDEQTASAGGYAGRLTRNDVTAEIEAAVFDADPGDLVGPMETENGWNLFLVKEVHEPSFEDVKDRVQLDMFSDLLAKLEAEADVEYALFE